MYSLRVFWQTAQAFAGLYPHYRILYRGVPCICNRYLLGYFGILLPIVVPIMQTGSEMLTITVAATLAGAVCGDHCSPISDTTIMASTGAQCDHINHVSTQLPYALTVAAVSAVNYVLAALIQNWMINLPIAIVSMVVVILAIRKLYGDKEVPAEK